MLTVYMDRMTGHLLGWRALAAVAAGQVENGLAVWIALGCAALVCGVAVLARRAWMRARGLGLPEEFGFAYDPVENIFYSEKDAWQRRFGYCELYDEAAPALGMVIDCEPVRFDYGGRRWLVEFWKGQYGLCTGAEIGIYSTDGPALEIAGVFDGTFYADTDLELEMSLELLKDGRALFSREQRHWWLTGFVLGEFSQPGELTIRARITFPDEGMRRAFTRELVGLGYVQGQVRSEGASAYLTVGAPRNPQAKARTTALETTVQENNRRLCETFQKAAGEIQSAQAQLAVVREKYPSLYGKLVRSSRSSGALYTPFGAIRKHLGKGE